LLELAPRRPQPRRYGVEIAPEGLGDLRRRHLLELGEDEDEDDAFVVVELIEQRVEQPHALGPRDGLVRPVALVDDGGRAACDP
jgi:hypothetical protein